VSPTTPRCSASPRYSPRAAGHPTAADGGFTHEYEFMPKDADAVATKEPGGPTRWTF
jgi:hypothetical protein